MQSSQLVMRWVAPMTHSSDVAVATEIRAEVDNSIVVDLHLPPWSNASLKMLYSLRDHKNSLLL
jgi:hypothetical protein